MHRFALCLAFGASLAATHIFAADGCQEIFPPSNGWAIDLCATDPQVPTPMAVVLDGVDHGTAALVRVYHETDDGSTLPQVAVFYASGFVRLKPNADPAPPIPFGSSFVLGPGYWPDAATYHHKPQLATLEVDTSLLPGGPLRLSAAGSNHAFDVAYAMTLPRPRDRLTRLYVLQTHAANAAVSIDATRRAESQGFKLVQVSSMYVNEGSTCDFGFSDCHDSDSARYVVDDLARAEAAFGSLTPSSFVFSSPRPLGSTWLDTLHRDDAGWQGNTPNIRIALDELPADRTVTPQGWISATTDPNDDNVNLWLHDDGPASQAWSPGASDQVGYWLLAFDDPPEPWADLGLRPGTTFLDMESGTPCVFVHDPGQGTSGSVVPIAGYADRAMELRYAIGSQDGNWAQIRCDFDPPLDLSACDHLRFDWRGDAAANSLEVAVISRIGGQDRIFGRGFHHASQRYWWGQMVMPFRFLAPWTPGTTLDPSQITAFFVSVVKDPVADDGGSGSIAVDNLSAHNVASRTVPAVAEAVPAHPAAAAAAADWLAGLQQVSGLVKSWQEELACVSHTYDQALALLVFVDSGRWSAADAVVGALADTQNANGSWFKSRDCVTLAAVGTDEWEGDVAWAIFALGRYLEAGGGHPKAAASRDAAADWLLTRIDPGDGCLVIDHTEGTIDAWWALATAGNAYTDAAARLASCLRTHYWDPVMGRFKGGRDWWQPYLDNQTWGAAFLRATGRGHDALRALSFAYEVLRLPAQGAQIHGFDGQGGPWSTWNEGTAQFAAVGGAGAADFVDELLAQQRDDGAMPSSPDDFAGGGVWTSRWHGVAPTAWLYLALTGGPFPPTVGEIFADGFESGDLSAWSSSQGGA